MPTAEELNLKFREYKRKRDKIVDRASKSRTDDPDPEQIPVRISKQLQDRVKKIAEKHGWSVRGLVVALLEHSLDDMERML